MVALVFLRRTGFHFLMQTIQELRCARREAERSLKIHDDRLPMPKNGDLRVWWIPQVPGKPFHVLVPDIRTAKVMLDALAQYDLFQLANKLKPDYSNVGGLEVHDGFEWSGWEDDEGQEIDAYGLDGKLV